MTVRRFLIRDALYSAAVVVFLLAAAIGLPAVDRSVPGLRRLPDGVPYRVGAGIELVPPPGALLDVSRSRPAETWGRAVLILADGQVRCLVVVSGYDGSLEQATERLRNRLERVAGVRLGASLATVRTAAGNDGQEGQYVPAGGRGGTGLFDTVQPDREARRAGRFAVFVIAGRVVEVTAVGPAKALRGVGESINECLTTITEQE